MWRFVNDGCSNLQSSEAENPCGSGKNLTVPDFLSCLSSSVLFSFMLVFFLAAVSILYSSTHLRCGLKEEGQFLFMLFCQCTFFYLRQPLPK